MHLARGVELKFQGLCLIARPTDIHAQPATQSSANHGFQSINERLVYIRPGFPLVSVSQSVITVQTIQYIQPQHHERLTQAELLVIDEAAAIPLPVVKRLLGTYLVFLCSTINGYEGTGRSLSLKLLHQLRAAGSDSASKESKESGRLFREVQLHEPIR